MGTREAQRILTDGASLLDAGLPVAFTAFLIEINAKKINAIAAYNVSQKDRQLTFCVILDTSAV